MMLFTGSFPSLTTWGIYCESRRHCQSQLTVNGAPLADKQSFCATLRKILFFTSLSRFSESDAKRFSKEVESFQGKYFPDGSFNLLAGLNEYARFRSLRKDELEVNPYQEIVNASDRFTAWVPVLMLLLVLRSGRTFAEMWRLKDAVPKRDT